MKKPKRERILDLIDQGIRRAQEVYLRGSKSLIRWGPEYLIATNIFQSLVSLRALSDAVSLEEKVTDIEEGRGNRRGRKPACCSGQSRCDLVVWHTEKDAPTPRAVIEVKRWANDCLGDIKRLTRLVNVVNGLEFSVAASCRFEKVVDGDGGRAEERLQKNVKQVRHDIEDGLTGKNLAVRMAPSLLIIEPITSLDESGKNEEWVWCPVCFVIYRKKDC